MVLISTYWNVNCNEILSRMSSRLVLISTYWNVNGEKSWIRFEVQMF